LAWMRKKGQKGSPGLNAMKAREAEHKAKRGVKGVKEGYRVLASADGQEKPSQFAYKDEKTAKKYADSIKKGGGKATVTKEGTYDEPNLEKRKKNNEKARKELKKDAKDSGYTDIALKASMSKGAGVSEAKVDQGRSDYGKATIRNWRHSGPDTVEPAMFDPENKRGKTIDKRREEHKARRGKKGAKVPTYKKESFSDWRTDLGEEGYDRMRDDRLVKYGIGHDGSDRKGSTSRPTGKQPKGKTVLQKETEKKYGKGVSALDVVKAKIRAKHGKDAIMKPKK